MEKMWDQVLEHWKYMSEHGIDSDHTPDADSCAFCKEFNNCDNKCDGCPIRDYTGQYVCKDTPYWVALKAYDDCKEDRCSNEHYKTCCVSMYNWLLKVRAEEEK